MNNEEKVEAKNEEETTVKSDVEEKIRKQIEKKQEKKERMGFYRIGEYLKEEHKWESYLFIVIALITLLLGCLILNGSLEVKNSFPLIGNHPTLFAWILVGLSSLGLLYAVWPFFKPAFPEFKKITWLTWPKFLGNLARTFIFMLIFVGLLYLYDAFMSEIFVLIFS
jgi:preprotein translocase subunit SecE